MELYAFQEKDKYGQNASKEVEKEEKEHAQIPFKCQVCKLNEVCHYFGKKPPFARGQIEFSFDTFVMMDPFSPREKGRPNFLIIGGQCHFCQNQVCVGCSIFYAKRFCRDCANLNFDQFPSEIQAKLKKMK